MSAQLCQAITLAGGFSIAIAMHFVAATHHGDLSWFALLPPIILYAAAPLPICLGLASKSAEDNVFDDTGRAACALHWAQFTGAAIFTLVFGSPIVLWHAGSLDDGDTLLTLGGIGLAAATVALGAYFSSRARDESDNWGLYFSRD